MVLLKNEGVVLPGLKWLMLFVKLLLLIGHLALLRVSVCKV